jgi:hypothetical protein
MEEQEGKDEGQSRNSFLTPDDAHRPRCALCGHCRAAATRFVLQRDEWIRGDVQHVRRGLVVVNRKESRWGRQHDMMQVQVVEIGDGVVRLSFCLRALSETMVHVRRPAGNHIAAALGLGRWAGASVVY